MSEHVQIVRDYIALRNYLARSNPQPNMTFEIIFIINNSSLMATNNITGALVELAKIQPHFFNLYLPHSGNFFEQYSISVIKFINRNLNVNELNKIESQIVNLAEQHRKNLNLERAYEPGS